MIYSDGELRTWWQLTTQAERRELIEKMVDSAQVDGFRAYAEGLLKKLGRGGDFSVKELAQIRKWV